MASDMIAGFGLNHLTIAFFLVAARIAGLVLTAPVFSSDYIPGSLRVAMIPLLALAVAPSISANLPGMDSVNAALIVGTVFQVLVGALIGVTLTLFLTLFGMAGEFVTYQMGLGLAEQADPGLMATGSFLSEWETLLAMFAFVAAGGLQWMVIALHASFTALPLNHDQFSLDVFSFVLGLGQSVLTIALLIASPLLLIGFIINIMSGVLSRAFPQMNTYFLELPANYGVSLLLLYAIFPLLFSLLPSIWHHAFLAVSRLLALLQGGTAP
ncbi:MAG: flagellar biosynthetic protein FliR [Firmicutes bacterium]|nr:flagellar biosynthetic protein FliR [Bacillota bacterium]